MDRFHLLEHTADIGIEAVAASRKGLAEQSGLGLRSLLYGKIEAAPLRTEPVEAEGNSVEETLVNWLNELLFIMTERQLVPAALQVEAFTDTRIAASVAGEDFRREKHQVLREIKAATHHQARVDQKNNLWTSRVYLDL